jgi:putative hydrolase of the HAD superfamily
MSVSAPRRRAPFLDKAISAKYYAKVKIKAVGFDLDGTLYPAWSMYAVSADLGIRHPFLLRAFSQARKRLRTQTTAVASERGDFGAGRLTESAAFKNRQASMVAKSLGADPSAIALSIDATVYSAIEKRFFRVKPYPGVAACLDALRRSGLPLGLLSDLPPKTKIRLLGFEEYFDFVLCSEDFGALKPDPRPFLALAAGFGLEPEAILYVGNKREYDIAGAKSLGMKTAFIGRRKDPEADFSFTKWEDLTRWILER